MRKIFFSLLLLFLISINASAQCWQSISSTWLHSAGIQQDGSLWTWGNNANGQLGDGTTTNRLVPTQIGTDTDWVLVVAGYDATYAIKQNGTLWAWGGNDKGQLSDGTTTSRLLPAQVLSGTTWRKVTSGEQFVVAQKNDGTLWSCGIGGNLGFNDSTERHMLEQINTDTDWLDLTCSSGSHVLLLKNNHTVWGFGNGSQGQLASGTDAGYATPTQLTLLNGNNFAQAIAERASSIFRKDDGTIFLGGGQYSNGNLGVGTPIGGALYTPQQEATLATDWRSIESASIHAMALKTNGTLWATGLNTSGQLGIGTSVARVYVFTQVGTTTNWAKVRCGRTHTLGLDTNGTLWAWGDNSYGQLGNGTTTGSLVPTQIGTACTMATNSYTKPTMHLLNNPVTSFMQLAFDLDGTKEVAVYNSLGMLLNSTSTSNDFISINVSGYATGVYFVTCKIEGAEQTIKVVKE